MVVNERAKSGVGQLTKSDQLAMLSPARPIRPSCTGVYSYYGSERGSSALKDHCGGGEFTFISIKSTKEAFLTSRSRSRRAEVR